MSTGTWGDLVREVFPDASNADADFLLWEHTGFPGFWRTDDPVAECRAQLEQFRDHGAACYRCGAYGTGNHGKPYVRQWRGMPFCRPCIKAVARETAESAHA